MLKRQPPRLRIIPLQSLTIQQHRLHVFRRSGVWLDGVLEWRSGITFPAWEEPRQGISCCGHLTYVGARLNESQILSHLAIDRRISSPRETCGWRPSTGCSEHAQVLEHRGQN